MLSYSKKGLHCRFDYVRLLNKEKISISMTQNGYAYGNPIA